MGLREKLIRNGNENRIMELHAAKCGVNQISGLFLDHGIKVSPVNIAHIIESHVALSSKALPKAAVKATIRAQKTGWNDAAPAA